MNATRADETPHEATRDQPRRRASAYGGGMTTTRRSTVGLLGAAVLFAGLAGCSPTPTVEPGEGGTTEAPSVVGRWASEEEGDPYLEFEEGDAVTGSDGCNGITTTYALDGTTVTLEPFTSTLKACSGVDPWLGDIATAEVSGDSLIVQDADGEEIGTLTRQ